MRAAHARRHVGDRADDPKTPVRLAFNRARPEELRKADLAGVDLVWLNPRLGDDFAVVDLDEARFLVA